ncbi:hypothetical protein AMTRI_Chr01g115060 [Amborella trichopoda]
MEAFACTHLEVSRSLIHEDGWTEVSHRGRSRNDHQRPTFDHAANIADGMRGGFINTIFQGKSSLTLEEAALSPHLEQPRSFLIIPPSILPYCVSQRSLDRNFLFLGDAMWLHVPCPLSNPPGEHVIAASLSNPVTFGVITPGLPPVLGK